MICSVLIFGKEVARKEGREREREGKDGRSSLSFQPRPSSCSPTHSFRQLPQIFTPLEDEVRLLGNTLMSSDSRESVLSTRCEDTCTSAPPRVLLPPPFFALSASLPLERRSSTASRRELSLTKLSRSHPESSRARGLRHASEEMVDPRGRRSSKNELEGDALSRSATLLSGSRK